MDIVYAQPLKELLQVTTFFNDKTYIIVRNELQEMKAKQKGLFPIFLVDKKTDLNKIQKKRKAVFGGDVEKNEFACRIKADFLLQPSDKRQSFDLGLAGKLAKNNTKVVLMFDELLSKNSFERALFWKNYLEIVFYCKKKGTSFLVASGAKGPFEIKAPKIRLALMEMLGMEKEKAKKEMGI